MSVIPFKADRKLYPHRCVDTGLQLVATLFINCSYPKAVLILYH
jgi:hypothetical protein